MDIIVLPFLKLLQFCDMMHVSQLISDFSYGLFYNSFFLYVKKLTSVYGVFLSEDDPLIPTPPLRTGRKKKINKCDLRLGQGYQTRQWQ